MQASAATTLEQNPARPEEGARMMERRRRLIRSAQIFAALLQLAILLSLWGRPAAQAIAAGFWAMALVGNVVLMPRVVARVGVDRSEHVRVAFNLAVHLPLGVVAHWNHATWMFMLFLVAFSGAPTASHFFERTLAIILCYDAVALATGASWKDALAFSGLSIFIYFVTTSYLELVSNLLRERHRYMGDLHEAQKLVSSQEKLASIGQIAAGVAHEINDPMCFVTANTQALLDDLRAEPGLPAELVEYRDEVIPETLDGIARVNSIVDDLRRFARGEPERFETFDLSVEIAAAARMARSRTRPGQVVDVELPSSLAITGSPRQLCQVVLNLIVNGLQAMPGDGRVVVSAAARGGAIEVVVSDDGEGMTEETKKRLFEPFYTTKAVRQGQGLGLSVVHGIVQSHGGSIQVESALGQGSKFYLRLPSSPLARFSSR
jgi:two-component system, NtrC family, sensor kinase